MKSQNYLIARVIVNVEKNRVSRDKQNDHAVYPARYKQFAAEISCLARRKINANALFLANETIICNPYIFIYISLSF